MLTDIEAFASFARGIFKRSARDVGALPAEAETWVPPAGSGEDAWTVGQLVSHIVDTRRLFLGIYRGEGWDLTLPEPLPRIAWTATLDASAEKFLAGLEQTPNEWLSRQVGIVGTDRTMAGWETLMRMTEHEIHHRSQIDTIAGLAGWRVPQVFTRTAEEVVALANQSRQA